MKKKYNVTKKQKQPIKPLVFQFKIWTQSQSILNHNDFNILLLFFCHLYLNSDFFFLVFLNVAKLTNQRKIWQIFQINLSKYFLLPFIFWYGSTFVILQQLKFVEKSHQKTTIPSQNYNLRLSYIFFYFNLTNFSFILSWMEWNCEEKIILFEMTMVGWVKVL